MKTTEEINYGFRSKPLSQEKYALVNYEIRIRPSENQNFIVPWQMVETKNKEVYAE